MRIRLWWVRVSGYKASGDGTFRHRSLFLQGLQPASGQAAQNRLTNGYAKDYNYDAAGRMLKYEATSNNQTFNSSFPLHAIKNSSYVYDVNGNMTTRVTPGGNQTLTWNNENHLTTVSGGGITTENYVYDADGNRVKKTVGTSTNFYYPFATYEISGTVAIKYYFFAGQRVAMKSGSTLTYLHGDHLGSTALATTSAGAWQSQEKYLAYGKDRDTANSVPTDHKFTGQKQDGSGLMYYSSRYYDPQIGLFVSPDTIVPDAGNVFSYNRTMYVFGKPLTLRDPSGHCPWCIAAGIGGVAGGFVGGGMYLWNESGQEDGVDLRVSVTWEDGWLPEIHGGDDWGDLGAAAGNGALVPLGGAGTLIGASMAGSQVADHVTNAMTGEDFNWAEHTFSTAASGASALVAPGVGSVAKSAVANAGGKAMVRNGAAFVAEGIADGMLSGVGNYLTGAAQGQGNWDSLPGDIGWGLVGNSWGKVSDLAPDSKKWLSFVPIYGKTMESTTRLVYSVLPGPNDEEKK